jgi:TonB family protein
MRQEEHLNLAFDLINQTLNACYDGKASIRVLGPLLVAEQQLRAQVGPDAIQTSAALPAETAHAAAPSSAQALLARLEWMWVNAYASATLAIHRFIALLRHNDPYRGDARWAAAAVAAFAACVALALPKQSQEETHVELAQAATAPVATLNVAYASSDSIRADEIVVRASAPPVWADVPSAQHLAALYPTRALERGREGEAQLHCVVLNGGELDCAPVEATSDSFGAAALEVSRRLRHAARRADGSSAVGTPVNLRVVFRLDDEGRAA